MKRILVATDGSEASAAAELEAVRLAHESDAELVVVHAWQPVREWMGEPQYGDAVARALRAGEDTFERPLALAHAAGVVATTELVQGQAGDVIVEVAETHDVDLIVVGARRYGIVLRFILGSVSHAVLQRSSRPVLVVKEGATLGAPEAVASGRFVA